MKNKHFTESERYILEHLLLQKKSYRQIRDILNRSIGSISYEVNRGKVKQLNSDLSEAYVYKADYAQMDYVRKLRNKEHDLKVGNNISFMKFVEEKVKYDHYSFYAALELWKASGAPAPVCTGTLYNYYHKKVFLDLKSNHMPYKKPKKKKEKEKKTVAFHNLYKRSIDIRPDEIRARDLYGHWEMDTVVSGISSGGRSALLVLTERSTLQEIIRKIPNKEAATVVGEIDKLEKKLGKKRFRNTFKSITMDNGSEFLDSAGIEKDHRTVTYYCHPYSSFERGLNESQNKMIRRWIPKGCDIGQFTDKDISMIEKWMNDYPRKEFNGLSSNEYRKYIMKL